MTWVPTHGLLAERRQAAIVRGWCAGTLVLGASDGTHFGVVRAGRTELHSAPGDFTLQAGMWFVAPGAAQVRGDGDGIVISSPGHQGLFSIGGPVEECGRLRYIDGCTDTVLVGPPRVGDPCLNALYFPAGTDQTPHTHPSLRAGVVLSGHGVCRLANGVEATLAPGVAFLIDSEILHAFSTGSEQMVVCAFHPDSDVGPSDEEHPMLTRTIVGGVPAHRLALS